MREDLHITHSESNIAVSITALFAYQYRPRLEYPGFAPDRALAARNRDVPDDGAHYPRHFRRLHHAGDVGVDESLFLGQGTPAGIEFLVHRFVGRLRCVCAVHRVRTARARLRLLARERLHFAAYNVLFSSPFVRRAFARACGV
jgi:hypothetical protein